MVNIMFKPEGHSIKGETRGFKKVGWFPDLNFGIRHHLFILLSKLVSHRLGLVTELSIDK